jgi:hypothetical protein
MKSNAAEKAATLPLKSTKTLTLRDASAACKHCGQPITWTRSSSGKIIARDPATEIDHRKQCTGIPPITRTISL